MYEIIYKYKEQSSLRGEYNEEIKEKKTKVGDICDDTPVEAVAGKIMAQLARRDILVVDVEIFEYSKKQVAYKQAEDGIVIRNKKFRYDDGDVVVPSEEQSDVEKLLELLKSNPDIVSQINKEEPKSKSTALAVQKPKERQRTRPIRYEVFNPPPPARAIAKAKGKFTVGKKYPIYSEEGDGIRIVYNTTDDAGNQVSCGAECFEVAVSGRLLHEDQTLDPKEKESVNLWQGQRLAGETTDNMPVLRR